MIEHLTGTHETVLYHTGMQMRLLYNTEPENYPPHWHTPFELIMPLENTYGVVCCGERYSLRKGDILLICPGVLHELFAPETGSRIIFQPSTSQIGLAELELITSILYPAVLLTPESAPKIYDCAHRLILEIYREYQNAQPFMESVIFSHFLELLALLGREHTESARRSFAEKATHQQEYVEKFQTVCHYINTHFAENLTLDQMADLAGFSKYHFTRLFRQYTGSSFYRYLNQKRIDHAKSLLPNPELTVIEIALASGFSSLSAFLRMFKQLNHCTPTEFRAMYRGPEPLRKAADTPQIIP